VAYRKHRLDVSLLGLRTAALLGTKGALLVSKD